MKSAKVLYDPATRMLDFACHCGSNHSFRAGLEPVSGILMSSRCPSCGRVYAYEVNYGGLNYAKR